MATIKIKFRPSTVCECEGSIFYQIIHERKVRQLLTGYKIYAYEWDETRFMVKSKGKTERDSFILSVKERIRWDMDRLTKIIHEFDERGIAYSADEVIERFNLYANKYSLFNYMESIIIKLKQNGKIRTSETYKTTLNNFKRFRNDEDIMLEC